MNYGNELDAILKKQLEILIDMANNLRGPFNPEFSQHWYHVYLDMLRNNE